MKRSLAWALALADAVLVAHLLLIPYALTPIPFDEALRRAALVRWDALGSDQNVALASRALMFLPLGLLLTAACAPDTRGIRRCTGAVAGLVLGVAWAVAVNFVQLWFPPRTVNLNNFAAETAGVAIGVVLWSGLGGQARHWWRRLTTGGHVSLRSALTGYVVLYLAASLLPFDFVTSAQEFAEKLASDLYALWARPAGCGPAPCGLKYLALAALAAPCGWWFAEQRHGDSLRGAILAALIVGLVVSAAIEALRFMMVSGLTQGVTLVLRVIGVLVGVAAHAQRARLAAMAARWPGRPLAAALAAPYLLVVAYVAGWGRAAYAGVEAGLARLGEVAWMPFYHQYYSPYAETMQSAMVHALLYAPVGAACWLWTGRRDSGAGAGAPMLAAALAFVAEASKLLLVGRKPDFTDVFIAALSAWAALAVLRFASRTQRPVPPRSSTQPVEASAQASAAQHSAGAFAAASHPEAPAPVGGAESDGTARLGGLAIAAGLLAAGVALLTVWGFPVQRGGLALGLAAYAALVVRHPGAYLIAIPALLPVLDLAALSGRTFWDEFDALLATTVAVRLLRPGPAGRWRGWVPGPAGVLMAVSVGASAVVGLWPPASLDANAFASYLGGYNALRVAKGYAWAALIGGLILRDAAAGLPASARLTAGLALGLASCTAGVFVERWLFLVAPEPDAAFRAAGLVSATHVGGAYLEATLVVLAPWGLAFTMGARPVALRLAALAAVTLGGLAVLFTYSRAAAAAYLLAVAVFALLAARARRPAAGRLRFDIRTALASALVLVVFVGVASRSAFLTQRLERSSADLTVRLAHWSDVRALMRGDAVSGLFGMGLGSFPREYYLAYAARDRLAAYRLEVGDDREPSRLALLGGHGQYVGQVLPVRQPGTLILTGRLRATGPDARLRVSLCFKSYMYAVGCTVTEAAAGAQWAAFTTTLTVPALRPQALAPMPPLTLSLQNPNFGTRVEVTGLSARQGDRETLRNGAFARGLDGWFMTSDLHLAWHEKNTLLQILFEQGLLGLLAWAAVGVGVVRRLRWHGTAGAAVAPPGLARTDRIAVGSVAAGAREALAASIAGVLVVASFDSLLDAPRLILLLALVACAVPPATWHRVAAGGIRAPGRPRPSRSSP